MHEIFSNLPHTPLSPEIFDDTRTLMHTPALVLPSNAPVGARFARRFVAERYAEPLLTQEDTECPISRRLWLKTLAASAGMMALPSSAQLIYTPNDDTAGKVQHKQQTPSAAETTALHRQSVRGYIPPDFWSRPRELWLRRQDTRDEVRAVYWKDGRIQNEGYWQICAILRDVRAHRMTLMDPLVLDILRGIYGFYQAWQHPYPIVITSGYRTPATNQALSKEGAAKNSMHLYGKAVDLYIPGVPAKDISALSAYMRLGGVGFYPDKGFTHIDTGKRRVWKG